MAGETAKNEEGTGDGDAKQEEIRRPVEWECFFQGILLYAIAFGCFEQADL